MKRNTIIFITLLSIITMLSCSYENTATVTIDTGIRKQAQLSLIDKFIAWFSLSKAVQADPVPPLDLSEIVVNITASDMQTITKDIPLETGKITLEVPAGSQRTFEVVAGYGDGTRIYGGIATVDLSPGQNVDLDIKMGELFYISDGNPYYYFDQEIQEFVIQFPAYDEYYPVAFKIYKEINNQLILERIITQFNVNYDYYYIYTIRYELDMQNNSYYLSGINQYGEGQKYIIYLP